MQIINNNTLFNLPWNDIGYHFGIEKVNGQYEILIGRPITEYGAQCKGMNNKSLGICFVGNYDLEEPPEEMLQVAATRLIKPLLEISGLKPEYIKGHGDYANKNCPGEKFDIYSIKC